MNNEMKNNDNTYTFRVKRNKVKKVKRTLQEVLFTELEKSVINYLEVEYVNEGKIFPDTETYEDIEEEVDDIINDFFEGKYFDWTNPVILQEVRDDLLSIVNNKHPYEYHLLHEEQLQEEAYKFLHHNKDWLINILNSFFIENILK